MKKKKVTVLVTNQLDPVMNGVRLIDREFVEAYLPTIEAALQEIEGTVDGVELVAGDRLGWCDKTPRENGVYQVTSASEPRGVKVGSLTPHDTGFRSIEIPPTGTDPRYLTDTPTGEGPTFPEWFEGDLLPEVAEGEEPREKPTLQQLFKRYREVNDRLDAIDLQIKALQSDKDPLLMAWGDTQELIDAQLKAQGIEKGKMEGYSYTYSKSKSTVVTDETFLPDECWTPKVDKDKIKKYIEMNGKFYKDEDGNEVPLGAYIHTKTELKIKPLTEKDDDE